MRSTGELKNMVFRKFRLNVVIRLILIAAAFGILIYYLFVSGRYIRSFYLGVFVILALVELFYYIDKSNRDVATFLQSILNSDFTSVFDAKKKGKSFDTLYDQMNQIIRRFRKISSEKEIQHLYLKTLVEQANVGLTSFNKGGTIHLINKAFRDILGIRPVAKGAFIADLPEEIHTVLSGLKPGDRTLITLDIKEKKTPLIFMATGFKIEKEDFMLVSVQNIRQELDEKELEAWQKLIRVLTHEIMNSATPIASLSSSLCDLLQTNGSGLVSENEGKRLVNGLNAIQDRSAGLMKFTEAYQTLARIPKPQMKAMKVNELVRRIEILFRAQMEKSKITLNIEQEGDIGEIKGDINLLDQVFINVIKNAIEALENRPDPTISIFIRNADRGRVLIQVTDNGVGMTEETREQIFVPFYTTKTKGSGIGLSLSKQIVRLHGGSIVVESEADKGTIFTIEI